MRDDEGFTLVEILISMSILAILIAAVGGAMIISLRTSDVTNARFAQSHDVQIASAYVANDVQSASAVDGNPTSGCSGALSPLVTFTYSAAGNPKAIYCWGPAANAETQVTRSFAGGPPIVIAHFSGPTRPDVVVTYDQAHPTVPVAVTMTFTKGSDCTLDCTYTLFGYRRTFDPSGGVGTGGPPTGDVVLLSTGAQSPLWVQGSCPSPGTTLGCIIDPAKTALPISDVTGFTSGWQTPPLWSQLNDADATTFVTSTAGSTSEARVLLSAVNPPDPGVLPTFEFHVNAATGTGATRVALSIYNGSTLLTSQTNVGPINQPKSYDWTLTAAQAAAITPASAYDHLTLGFAVTSARPSNAQSISVDGVAFDSLDVNAVGLLTIKGPLYVNSQLTNAVRLTGTKNATKISIVNNGDFQIWNPGACSGCNHQTVACTACGWVGEKPWTSYTQTIPDPLRALPAPTVPPNGSCSSGICQPGFYPGVFSPNSDTALRPGIYYLNQGISIAGNVSLSCLAPCTGGVMLYIAGGSVSFTGQSRVNLPALNGKVFVNGLYDGIVMFQSRDNHNALKFAGNSGSSTFCTMGGVQFGNCFGGIVYVPQADQVTLATGSASFAAKAIVSQNVKVSSAVTIG
jgi:prepilin-type N-terminal cleavage/methylation domain-containing protein